MTKGKKLEEKGRPEDLFPESEIVRPGMRKESKSLNVSSQIVDESEDESLPSEDDLKTNDSATKKTNKTWMDFYGGWSSSDSE